jgi:hypothetical protein
MATPKSNTGPSMSARIININSEEEGKMGWDKGRDRAIERKKGVE